MTLWDLIRATLRRWPIALAGVIAVVALGYLATTDDGVYHTRTEVVFLAPSSELNPNSLRTTSADLIVTAGVVSKAITGPGRVTKFAGPDSMLIGTGVRDGWSIRLPDTGGQWASNFSSQVLVVEVVGPDAESVRAKQEELVGRIADELEELQRAQGVDPINDITSTVLPDSAVIEHVGGSRIRAVAGAAALGAGATFALVVLLEHRRRRRASTDAPLDDTGATAPDELSAVGERAG
ncbi:hypothetical protein ACFVTX_05165 [Agromyces sp. NPDC058136]|uniref:hypothetical protein n=1 Tax=Agromyces sp. NPDC058136 TaxID=3346354 RepID=UPI0036DD4416